MQSEFISDGSLKSIAARGGVLLDKGCLFNPLTLKISLIILLTVSQMIGIGPISNPIIEIFLYSHHLST